MLYGLWLIINILLVSFGDLWWLAKWECFLSSCCTKISSSMHTTHCRRVHVSVFDNAHSHLNFIEMSLCVAGAEETSEGHSCTNNALTMIFPSGPKDGKIRVVCWQYHCRKTPETLMWLEPDMRFVSVLSYTRCLIWDFIVYISFWYYLSIIFELYYYIDVGFLLNCKAHIFSFLF